MDGFLDIYSKLIIALISFTAPIMIALLSVASEAISIERKRAEEKAKQVSAVIRMQGNPELTNVNQEATESNEEFKIKEKEERKKTRFLNPKLQMLRLSSSLGTSLLCVMVYKGIEDPNDITLPWILIVLILVSELSLAYSLFVFGQIFCACVDAKELIVNQPKNVPVAYADK